MKRKNFLFFLTHVEIKMDPLYFSKQRARARKGKFNPPFRASMKNSARLLQQSSSRNFSRNSANHRRVVLDTLSSSSRCSWNSSEQYHGYEAFLRFPRGMILLNLPLSFRRVESSREGGEEGPFFFEEERLFPLSSRGSRNTVTRLARFSSVLAPRDAVFLSQKYTLSYHRCSFRGRNYRRDGKFLRNFEMFLETINNWKER